MQTVDTLIVIIEVKSKIYLCIIIKIQKITVRKLTIAYLDFESSLKTTCEKSPKRCNQRRKTGQNDCMPGHWIHPNLTITQIKSQLKQKLVKAFKN